MSEPRRATLRRPPAWALLVALVAVSTGLRAWGGALVPSPWISPDEFIYTELGRSLWQHGTLAILGHPTNFYSLLYPAFAGLPLSLGNVDLGYTLLKALQALVMSLAAVPVYLWGRSLMSRGWALAAAALTVAIPGLAYSGLVMTEVLFYPLSVAAAWAIALALERRTPESQLLAVALIAVVSATRLQGAVLGAVLVTALLLVAAFERRLAVVRELRFALIGLGVLAVGWIVWRLARGGPASELFGAYRAAGETGYSVGAILRYVRWHAADLIVVTGVVPTCALVVLLVGAARGRERSPAARAFLAVAVSTVVWLVVEVGVFASVHVGHLAERDLLAAVPLLFLALGLWCDRGAPRPLAAAATAAALVLLLVAAAPVARLVEPAVVPDAFSLVPLVHLELGSPGFPLRLLVILLAAALVAAFWLVPRRALVAVPLVLVAGLAALSVSATQEVAASARATKRQMLGTTPRWIDRHARGDVTFLYSGEAYPQSVWANLFWNHKLTQVVDLLDAHVSGPLPQPAVGPFGDGSLVLADGTGRPVAFDYAVAPQSLSFDGALVADEPFAQLGLWRVRQPTRLEEWRKLTLSESGDVRQLELDRWACPAGHFELEVVSPRAAQEIALLRNGKEIQRLTIPADTPWRRTISAEPPAPVGTRLCTFLVAAGGGGISVPRLDFVPAKPAG
jgi:hypothetical protein